MLPLEPRRAAMWLAAAAALAAAGTPRRAQACSCAPPAFSPAVYPRDGAEAVPRNTALVVFDQLGEIEGAPALVHAERGEAVALEVDRFERRLDQQIFWLAPAQLLEPGARYELRGAGGEAIASFEVGDEIDDSAPAAPEEAALELRRYHPTDHPCETGQCWARSPFEKVSLRFAEPDDDVVLAVAELFDPGESEPRLRAPISWSELYGGAALESSICAAYDPPELGDALCARLVFLDGAGNSAESELICADTRDCAAHPDCMTFDACIAPAGDAGAGSPDAGSDVPDAGASAPGGGGCRALPGGGAGMGLGVLVALALGQRGRRRRG